MVVPSILLNVWDGHLKEEGAVWRKALLLKYIGLPIPFKKKSTFNFSQTVGEMVFVSFEVEKVRMFLVQSVVRWYWVDCGVQ